MVQLDLLGQLDQWDLLDLEVKEEGKDHRDHLV